MSKAFYGTLVSKALTQMKNVEPKLVRAGGGFLFEESIDCALFELKECQQLLELAKLNYRSSYAPVASSSSTISYNGSSVITKSPSESMR